MTLDNHAELRTKAVVEQWRSRRRALGAVAVVAVVAGLAGVLLGGTDGSVVLVAVPILALALAFVVAKRASDEPPLALGADAATQEAVRKALRDGGTDDPRIDALARDSAARAGRRTWPLWLLGAGALIQVASAVRRITGDNPDWFLVGAALLTVIAFGLLGFTLLRDRRRAKRYPAA